MKIFEDFSIRKNPKTIFDASAWQQPLGSRVEELRAAVRGERSASVSKVQNFVACFQIVLSRVEILPWVAEMVRSQYMEKHLLIRIFR